MSESRRYINERFVVFDIKWEEREEGATHLAPDDDQPGEYGMWCQAGVMIFPVVLISGRSAMRVQLAPDDDKPSGDDDKSRCCGMCCCGGVMIGVSGSADYLSLTLAPTLGGSADC